jgi:ornithine cyclodeaminase/alanine dehydrogenase-like protein (mu-crystallin family)
MPLLFLNREDVEALLPMEECIEVVEAGLRVLARGGAVQPLRSAYWMPDRHGHAYRKALASGRGTVLDL